MNKDLGIGVKGTLFWFFLSRCVDIVHHELKDRGVPEDMIRPIEALAFGIALMLLI